MMNLVMFAYFAIGDYFLQLTDVNVKDMMFKNQMKAIEEDILPFGYVDDGIAAIEEADLRDVWATTGVVADFEEIY